MAQNTMWTSNNIIPDGSTITISDDGKTVVITANPNTCFKKTSPTINVWDTTGSVVVSGGSATLSVDKKTISYTYAGENKISKVELKNADTINFDFAEDTPTKAKLKVWYNTETNRYVFDAYAEYGYNFYVDECALDIDGSFKGADYAEEDWPLSKHIWWSGSNVSPGTTNEVYLDIRADESEPLKATIVTPEHTSYSVYSIWDETLQSQRAILEITTDQYWHVNGSATPKAVIGTVELPISVNYYNHTLGDICTCDITDYIGQSNTINISGLTLYHIGVLGIRNNVGNSSWYVNENILTVNSNPGYWFPLSYVYDALVPDYQKGYVRIFVAKATVTSTYRIMCSWAPSRKTVTIDLSSVPDGDSVVIDGIDYAVLIPTTPVELGYNLNNCSVQGAVQTSIQLDDKMQMTLVANQGYQFNTPPTVRYYDSWDNAIQVPFTVSQDKLSAVIDWYPGSVDLSNDYPGRYNFLITGNAAAVPPQPFEATIVNNISGTTYNQANDVISVYAPNGYVFSAAPTLGWTNGTDSGTATFTMGSDGKSATINASAWRTSAYTLTIQGAIEEEHTWGPSSITNNVANTTHSLSGTTLTVVCDTGYVFDAAPVIAQAGSAGPITMTLNSSGTIASVDITAYDELAVVITGSTSESTEPPTPSTNHTVYTRLTNCTGSGIPGVVDEDDVLNITLTANSGYEFDTDYLPSVEYIKSDNLTYREYFTLSSDGSTATITLNTADLGLKAESALTVVGQAYETEPTPPGPEPPYTDKYGLVNIYNPTTSELQQFAAQRFRYDQNMMPFDDLGNYVTSLKRVYVTMPATTDTTISAGRYHTTITSRTPVTDIVNLDFGTILLPAHNLDVLDGNSKVSIFLPFVGFVDVNPEFCGSSIALTYQVNIVTGEGVAKLSRNNIVFAIYPCRPSTDMAYRSNTMMSQTLGGSEFNTMYLYGLKPYAIVKWYTSMNQHLLNNDCHRGVIGTYHGYAKFTEVTDINNGQITAEEKNLLIRTLAGGVYIETNEP